MHGERMRARLESAKSGVHAGAECVDCCCTPSTGFKRCSACHAACSRRKMREFACTYGVWPIAVTPLARHRPLRATAATACGSRGTSGGIARCAGRRGRLGDQERSASGRVELRVRCAARLAVPEHSERRRTPTMAPSPPAAQQLRRRIVSRRNRLASQALERCRIDAAELEPRRPEQAACADHAERGVPLHRPCTARLSDPRCRGWPQRRWLGCDATG